MIQLHRLQIEKDLPKLGILPNAVLHNQQNPHNSFQSKTTDTESLSSSGWGVQALLSLLPLSGGATLETPLVEMDDKSDVSMYAKLVEYLYLFTCEIVRLRKQCNHYTEALLKDTWKKNEQFLEQYQDDDDSNDNSKRTSSNAGGLDFSNCSGDRHPSSNATVQEEKMGYVVGEEDEDE